MFRPWGPAGRQGGCPQSGELVVVGPTGEAGNLARKLWVQPRMPRLRWGSFRSGSGGCPQSSELVMGPDRDAGVLAMGFGGAAMGPAADAHGLVGLAGVVTGLAGQLWAQPGMLRVRRGGTACLQLPFVVIRGCGGPPGAQGGESRAVCRPGHEIFIAPLL